ncbi:hypothetical protein SO802_012319 [Lithocarpus litseifolius]|uniref:Zinc knuckle CX2CX4HX4C domain-containing protein n=1 Tax=Lithocarpus litseifolius TaxID=425828 RepID=A0AAW2D2F3_9ROSI
MNPEGSKSRIGFKYERLVGLCFQYGWFGHERQYCTTRSVGHEEETPYGEWLRADNKIKEDNGRLVDLGFQGNKYTWNNGQPGATFMQERLDQACALVEWQEIFSHVKVSHLQASYSDHIPILINGTSLDQRGRRKKIPRQFKMKWPSNAECENVVRHA